MINCTACGFGHKEHSEVRACHAGQHSATHLATNKTAEVPEAEPQHRAALQIAREEVLHMVGPLEVNEVLTIIDEAYEQAEMRPDVSAEAQVADLKQQLAAMTAERNQFCDLLDNWTAQRDQMMREFDKVESLQAELATTKSALTLSQSNCEMAVKLAREAAAERDQLNTQLNGK